MTLSLRPRSIRTRITLWHLGVLTLTLTVFVITTQMFLKRQLTTELKTSLEEEVDEIATLFLKPDESGNLVWRENHDDIENEYRILVTRADGFPIFQNVSFAGSILPPASTISARPGVTFDHLSMMDGEQLLMAQAIRNVSGIDVVIRVSRSTAQLHREMRQLLLIQLLCFPLALLLAWAGGSFIAGRVLLPLQQIITRMKTLTAQRLDEKLPVKNPDDELGHLSITFNQLLAQLDHAFTQMRQFTGDASHELRTPLTAMRSVGEVALRAPLSPEEYRETIANMLEEVEKMGHLVSDLLALARADSGTIRLDLRKEDLGRVVSEETARLEILAEEKQQILSLTIKDACPVCLDRSIFRQAFANVLFNAIQYSSARTDIEVLVTRDEKNCLVEITDSGPGIAPEHQSRIFDRFYRVDKVRSRQNGGSGLGLAIARWAVEIHGGRLELRSRMGQGSTFSIHLPLQPDACPPPSATTGTIPTGQPTGGRQPAPPSGITGLTTQP